jgi:hypothetical protein
MEHRGRGYHIHRSTGDKGCLLMYCSQSGELLPAVAVPLYSSLPYNLSEDFRTNVCTLYSSKPGELLAGRCTFVQLTTIQLIRRFPYSCTAHNHVIIGWSLYLCTAHNHTTYQKISVLMYCSQSCNLLPYCTAVPLVQ